MGVAKWIGGLIGWASGGPIGALIGILLGSLFEAGTESESDHVHDNGSTPQKNSFLISLLVLSSAVIRADGQFRQSELSYVRLFIRNNFGSKYEKQAMDILNELNSQEINIYSVGSQISANMNYSQRLQLFHYLIDLANADGGVCAQEISVLEAIASAIGISRDDTKSLLAMFSGKSESAYRILETSPSASNEEVKAAYRRLAMKHHPDKVASLGPEVQKAAEDKFRKIQAAYETIKRERGIN